MSPADSLITRTTQRLQQDDFMATEADFLAFASLIISIFAASISLLRFKKESRIRRQADTVSVFYDIVRLIDSNRAVESRGLLRANSELNRLRDRP